jgi:hypothetical protein
VDLRSFWHHFHVHLTSQSTAAVSYYPQDMGALSKLIFGGDRYFKAGKWVYPKPATLEVAMTEANFGSKNLGEGGAIIISAWLTHKDKGAISTVVMHKFPLPINDIKTKAELDLSGKELDALEAVVIAALLPLNVSRAIFGYAYYC